MFADFITMRTTLVLAAGIIAVLTIIGLGIVIGYDNAPENKEGGISPEQWFWMKARFGRSLMAVILHVGLLVWAELHNDKWYICLFAFSFTLIWLLVSYVEMYNLGTEERRVKSNK